MDAVRTRRLTAPDRARARAPFVAAGAILGAAALTLTLALLASGPHTGPAPATFARHLASQQVPPPGPAPRIAATERPAALRPSLAVPQGAPRPRPARLAFDPPRALVKTRAP